MRLPMMINTKWRIGLLDLWPDSVTRLRIVHCTCIKRIRSDRIETALIAGASLPGQRVQKQKLSAVTVLLLLFIYFFRMPHRADRMFFVYNIPYIILPKLWTRWQLLVGAL